jgi:protein-disulfide isomerase
MAKKATASKSAPKGKEEVIEIDLRAHLTPISILLASIILSVVLLIGLLSINSSIKKLNGTSNSSSEVAGTTDEETTTDDESTEEIDLANGDALSTTVSDATPVAGSSDARVAIVEYGDFACGYCKRHDQETLDSLLTNYVDKGTVKYYFKDFAIFTPEAARAGQCVYKIAGNEKYLQFHKTLFAQDEVTGEQDQLLEVAGKIGVNKDEVKSCMETDEIVNKVQADYDQAVEIGLRGTPGFVVGVIKDDGTVEGEFVQGAQPYSYFEEVLAKYIQ